MRPLFETPRFDDLEATAGSDLGFGASVSAGWEAQRNLDNFNASQILRRRVWDEYFEEVEGRLGHEFYQGGSLYGDLQDIRLRASAGHETSPTSRDPGVQAFYARLAELREQNPALDLPGYEWVDERMRGEAARMVATEGQAGTVGGFVGRIGGALTDPVSIATAPFGAGTGSVLRAAGVEAALNGLLETANIPIANQWREALGVETMGLGEAAQSVAFAAGAGAILGGGVRGIEVGFQRLSNAKLARAVRELSEDDPYAAALADALDREAEIEARNPFREADADLHEARLSDAMTVITERGTDRAVAAAARLGEETAAPVSAPEMPAGLSEVDPRELQVDAARFQFKDGGDSQGVTDRLGDVTEWDPVRAGIAIVYEQTDGMRFIADGHQRRGLAARLLEENPDTNIRMTAYVFREADGWSDAQIRAMAAAKNLAEGTGTAIDAAKVLRADPDLLDGSLPRRGALIRDAQGLMGLGDEAFGAIINDVIPANFGAIVGRLIDDPAEQMAVIAQIARAEVRNAIEAEALVRGAQAAGFARREGETGSLFGEMPTESLLADRARVLSRAISIIRKEKGVFSTLAREADRIETAGNRLVRAANQERAETDGALLEILQTLAHRTGPVAEALNARVRAAGGRYGQAARDFVGDLRDLTSSGDLGRLLAGGTGRAADAPAPQRPASGQALERAEPLPDPEPERFGGGADDPAAKAQANDLAEPDADLTEEFPAEMLFEPGEVAGRSSVSRGEIEAEIEADDAAVERLRGCVP